MTKFLSASEWCDKTREQNCHACENANCGDNTTPSIVELKGQIRDLHDLLQKEGIDPNLGLQKIQLAKKIRILDRRNARMASDLNQQRTVVKDLMEKNSDLAFDLATRGEELAALRDAVADAIVVIGNERHSLKEVTDAVQTAKALKEGNG